MKDIFIDIEKHYDDEDFVALQKQIVALIAQHAFPARQRGDELVASPAMGVAFLASMSALMQDAKDACMVAIKRLRDAVDDSSPDGHAQAEALLELSDDLREEYPYGFVLRRVGAELRVWDEHFGSDDEDADWWKK